MDWRVTDVWRGVLVDGYWYVEGCISGMESYWCVEGCISGVESYWCVQGCVSRVGVTGVWRGVLVEWRLLVCGGVY